MSSQTLDLDGKRFGRLVASNQLERRGRHTVRLCLCDCGTETWTSTNNLIRHKARSCGCSRTRMPGMAARNQVLDTYKRDAKKRDLTWCLSDEEFDALTNDICFYCHRPPQTRRVARGSNGAFVYNGIDRKDNTIGYITSNVVTCCEICNRAKRDMPFDDFVSWLEDVAIANLCTQ